MNTWTKRCQFYSFTDFGFDRPLDSTQNEPILCVIDFLVYGKFKERQQQSEFMQITQNSDFWNVWITAMNETTNCCLCQRLEMKKKCLFLLLKNLTHIKACVASRSPHFYFLTFSVFGVHWRLIKSTDLVLVVAAIWIDAIGIALSQFFLSLWSVDEHANTIDARERKKHRKTDKTVTH